MVALFKAGRMVLFIQSLQVIKEIPPGLIYPRALLLKKASDAVSEAYYITMRYQQNQTALS